MLCIDQSNLGIEDVFIGVYVFNIICAVSNVMAIVHLPSQKRIKDLILMTLTISLLMDQKSKVQIKTVFVFYSTQVSV